MFKTIFLAYIRRLKRDDLSTYAAQIAFFSLLSILPFLLMISMWLSRSNILDINGLLVMLENSGALPQSGLDLLRGVLSGLDGTTGLFSVSTLMVIWASSKMLRSIMTGIHMAYRERDSRSIFLKYFLSILYTILLSIGIVLMLVMTVFGEKIWQMLGTLGLDDRFLEVVWNIARLLIPVSLILLIFWSLYTVLPCRRTHMRDTLPGSLLSPLALLIVSQVFSFFVNHSRASVLYGSLSGFMAILFWFFLFGYILMLGMELNAVMYDLPEYQFYQHQRRELRLRIKENKKQARRELRAQKKERRKAISASVPEPPSADPPQSDT